MTPRFQVVINSMGVLNGATSWVTRIALADIIETRPSPGIPDESAEKRRSFLLSSTKRSYGVSIDTASMTGQIPLRGKAEKIGPSDGAL
jgi:hypothetical protein